MSPKKEHLIPKPDRNGMMTTVLTPRKNEDIYNQGSPSRSPDRERNQS